MYIFFLYVIYTKHCNIESSQNKKRKEKKRKEKKKLTDYNFFLQHCISNYTQGHAYKVSTQGVLFIFYIPYDRLKWRFIKESVWGKGVGGGEGRGVENNMAASGWSWGLRGIGEFIKKKVCEQENGSLNNTVIMIVGMKLYSVTCYSFELLPNDAMFEANPHLTLDIQLNNNKKRRIKKKGGGGAQHKNLHETHDSYKSSMTIQYKIT